MSPIPDPIEARAYWPPAQGERISFKIDGTVKEGILKEVRPGLVWRDFLLVDGRIIPEHKVIGCPDSVIWRDPDSVSAEERQAWERRLVTMAEAGIDPYDREHELWAALTQYLAHTYLRFKRMRISPRDVA